MTEHALTEITTSRHERRQSRRWWRKTYKWWHWTCSCGDSGGGRSAGAARSGHADHARRATAPPTVCAAEYRGRQYHSEPQQRLAERIIIDAARARGWAVDFHYSSLDWQVGYPEPGPLPDDDELHAYWLEVVAAFKAAGLPTRFETACGPSSGDRLPGLTRQADRRPT